MCRWFFTYINGGIKNGTGIKKNLTVADLKTQTVTNILNPVISTLKWTLKYIVEEKRL